jgi:drug/metabolite transporter (DMT)-like permease
MHKKAYLLLLATTLFWAGNAVAGKLAVGHLSPMLFNAARWGFMLAILLAMGRKHLARDWAIIRRHWWYLLFTGAIGFTGFGVAMYSALVYTSATNVSIEQGGIPLFVFLASYLLFGTRTTPGQIAGFALSFIGVVVTATNGEVHSLLHLGMNFGDALMLLAIVAFGLYTAIVRRKPDMHWMSLMTALCIGATLSAIPFVAAEAAAGAIILPDTQGWMVILYAVIFPSLIGQALYVRAVELIGSNRAGIFINFLPVWGALLALVILGEAFHVHHAVALAMVVAGVVLAEYSGHRAENRQSSLSGRTG